ncbi:MAG: hypothetical protein AAF789_09500 [Bacteroidota bacterium]
MHQLKYVGITHKTADTKMRSYFSFNNEQQQHLIYELQMSLGLKGIVLLCTCSRTEVYYEAESVPTKLVARRIGDFIFHLHSFCPGGEYFIQKEETAETAKHLLRVAAGLESIMTGDKQIFGQVKSAYQRALAQHLQGTLLERAFQSVFKVHKRIHAQTSFLSGSTSYTYSSLKIVEKKFGKATLETKRILIIGAGEIIQNLLQYFPKFRFQSVHLSNRNHEKASGLAKKYGLKLEDWQSIETNSFDHFDIIIAGVSNRKHLINRPFDSQRERILIDLAMPSNVDPALQNEFTQLINIDQISSENEQVKMAQEKAIPTVNYLLDNELRIFLEWVDYHFHRRMIIMKPEIASTCHLTSKKEIADIQFSIV